MSGIWDFNFKGFRWLCASSSAGCSWSFLSGASSTPCEQPFAADVPLVCHLWFLSQPMLYLPSSMECPLRLLTGPPTLSHVGWLPQISETVEEEPHSVSFTSSKAVRPRRLFQVLIVIQDRTWLLGSQLKQPLYCHVNEKTPWVLPFRSREGVRLSSFTSWTHGWEQSCPQVTLRDLFNGGNLKIAASFSAHDLAAALSSLVFLSSPNRRFVAPPPSPVAASLQTYIGRENSVDNRRFIVMRAWNFLHQRSSSVSFKIYLRANSKNRVRMQVLCYIVT